MSQFGNRLPSIVPKPLAVPDMTKAAGYGEAQNALASVLGIGTQVANQVTTDTARKTSLDRMASDLQIDRMELEQAAINMETEEARRKSFMANLTSDELKQRYSEMADLEQFGVTKMLASMTPDEQAAYLAANPVADPQNAEKIARSLGYSLAQSASTRMMQEIVEARAKGDDLSGVRVTDIIARELGNMGQQADQLHPEAIDTFYNTLLQQGEGFLRGQLHNTILNKQGIASKTAQSQAMNIAARSMMGDFPPGQFAEAVTDRLQVVPGARESQTAMANAVAKIVADQVGQQLSIGTNPEDIKAWITQEFNTNTKVPSLGDASGRHFAEKVLESFDGMALIQTLDAKIEQNASSAVAREVASLKSNIIELGKIGDIMALQSLVPRVEALPDNHDKFDMQVRLRTAITQSQTTQSDTTRILAAIVDGSELGPVTEKSVNNAYEQAPEALAWIIQKTGVIPGNVVRDVQNSINTNNLDRAVSMLRKVEAADPVKAQGLLRSLKNGGTVQMAMTLTRGMDESDPEYNRIMQIAGDRQAHALIAQANEKLDAKGTKNRYYGSGSTSAAVTPELILEYDSAFRFAFIEASLRNAGSDDPKSQGQTILRHAQKEASEAVNAKFIGVEVPGFGPVHVRNDVLGIGTNAAQNREMMQKLHDAMNVADGAFEEWFAADIHLRPDLAVQENGLAYIPAVGLDIEGTAPGYSVVSFMEWEPGRGKYHALRAENEGELIARLKNRVYGVVEPDELDPSMQRAWKPEYGSRSIEEHDAKYYGDAPENGVGEYFYKKAKRRWLEVYGQMPDIGDKEARAAFENLGHRMARREGWSPSAGVKEDDE